MIYIKKINRINQGGEEETFKFFYNHYFAYLCSLRNLESVINQYREELLIFQKEYYLTEEALSLKIPGLQSRKHLQCKCYNLI